MNEMTHDTTRHTQWRVEPLLERCREESGSRVVARVVEDSRWAVGQPAEAGGRMARVALVVVDGAEGKGEPDGSCRAAVRLQR